MPLHKYVNTGTQVLYMTVLQYCYWGPEETDGSK